MAESSPRRQAGCQSFCGLYAFFPPLGEVLSPFLRRNLYASSIVLYINSTQESTMSILSVLAFTAVGASRQGRAMAFVGEHPAASRRANACFELITVVVASKDALLARKALLACPETTVVRCLPKHKDDKVELEIRFPAGRSNTVIDRILAALPNGEIGGIVACANPCLWPRGSHFSGDHRHGI
jgi:hypothetical protein